MAEKELKSSVNKNKSKFLTRPSSVGKLRSSMSVTEKFRRGSKVMLRKFSKRDSKIEKLNVKEALRSVLPPKEPAKFRTEGTEEISFYTTTFKTKGLDHGIPKEAIPLWIPKGYDVYCVCLQSVKGMTATGNHILDYIQSPVDLYQQFVHFVGLDDVEDDIKRSVTTYLFVRQTLINDEVFQRTDLQKIVFPRRLTEGPRPCAGASVVTFKIFDTTVRIVNCQLTVGHDRDLDRKSDIGCLFAHLDTNKKPDHTFLMGDFALTSGAEVCTRLTNLLHESNEIGWDNSTFLTLLDKHDEMKNALRPHSPQLDEFEEMEVNFPPTDQRKPNRYRKVTTKVLVEMLKPRYDMEKMYVYLTDTPCYPDRIMFLSKDWLRSCLRPGQNGTSEGLMLNNRVPVFNSFRMAGRSYGNKNLRRASSIDTIKTTKTTKTAKTLPISPKPSRIQTPKFRDTARKRRERMFEETHLPPAPELVEKLLEEEKKGEKLGVAPILANGTKDLTELEDKEEARSSKISRKPVEILSPPLNISKNVSAPELLKIVEAEFEKTDPLLEPNSPELTTKNYLAEEPMEEVDNIEKKESSKDLEHNESEAVKAEEDPNEMSVGNLKTVIKKLKSLKFGDSKPPPPPTAMRREAYLYNTKPREVGSSTRGIPPPLPPLGDSHGYEPVDESMDISDDETQLVGGSTRYRKKKFRVVEEGTDHKENIPETIGTVEDLKKMVNILGAHGEIIEKPPPPSEFTDLPPPPPTPKKDEA